MEDNQNNESASEKSEKKFTQLDFVVAQIKIENAMSLFNQVDWNVINKMLDITPEESKSSLSYRVLESARTFYEGVEEIYRDNERSGEE